MKKIIMLIMILTFILPVGRINAEDLKFAENARSAILIEASTGEIIFEKNSHERLNPASMTKMMSMLLIVENIEKGVISWDDMVTVSENASSMGGSQILLETNEKMSVKDLFKGIAVASGNDAVVAMAEKIAGTEEAFVSMMNNRAKELGLKDTSFKNPHGLDTANHYSSAYDMSIIAKELVKHQEVLKYTSIYEDYLRQGTNKQIWLVNTNKLVRFYEGVDGLKTGYTQEAGYCLTATAKKNNMRIIAVVMGEPDSKTRNAEVTSMLDYSFAQYNLDTLLSKESILGTKQIEKGKEKYATIVPLEDVNVLRKKIDDKKEITYTLNVGKLTAPIKQGDVIGTVDIKENNNVIKTVNVTLNKTIEKANFLEVYFNNLIDILSGTISFN